MVQPEDKTTPQSQPPEDPKPNQNEPSEDENVSQEKHQSFIHDRSQSFIYDRTQSYLYDKSQDFSQERYSVFLQNNNNQTIHSIQKPNKPPKRKRGKSCDLNDEKNLAFSSVADDYDLDDSVNEKSSSKLTLPQELRAMKNKFFSFLLHYEKRIKKKYEKYLWKFYASYFEKERNYYRLIEKSEQSKEEVSYGIKKSFEDILRIFSSVQSSVVEMMELFSSFLDSKDLITSKNPTNQFTISQFQTILSSWLGSKINYKKVDLPKLFKTKVPEGIKRYLKETKVKIDHLKICNEDPSSYKEQLKDYKNFKKVELNSVNYDKFYQIFEREIYCGKINDNARVSECVDDVGKAVRVFKVNDDKELGSVKKLKIKNCSLKGPKDLKDLKDPEDPEDPEEVKKIKCEEVNLWNRFPNIETLVVQLSPTFKFYKFGNNHFLTNLKKLYLNNLTMTNKSIHELFKVIFKSEILYKTLDVLSCANNKITEIRAPSENPSTPSDEVTLFYLKELNLEGNKIYSVEPRLLERMPKLKVLNLSGNNFGFENEFQRILKFLKGKYKHEFTVIGTRNMFLLKEEPRKNHIDYLMTSLKTLDYPLRSLSFETLFTHLDVEKLWNFQISSKLQLSIRELNLPCCSLREEDLSCFLTTNSCLDGIKFLDLSFNRLTDRFFGTLANKLNKLEKLNLTGNENILGKDKDNLILFIESCSNLKKMTIIRTNFEERIRKYLMFKASNDKSKEDQEINQEVDDFLLRLSLCYTKVIVVVREMFSKRYLAQLETTKGDILRFFAFKNKFDYLTPIS